ncbi:MAG: HXXEE domain-containing protein [Bacteroidales bacterium]|nr:HXXEE domain-containing protein [Bacteroidales bacterium]
MEPYLWLFPVLFIFHDFEEIIGFRWWLDRNKDILQTCFPRFFKQFDNYTTEGFALAVFEEFVVCSIGSALAVYVGTPLLLYIWLGGFIGFTFHLFVHIVQSVVLRKYIPALITSVLTLPVCVYIVYQCFSADTCIDVTAIVGLAVGFAAVFVNLIFALRLMWVYNNRSRKDN